MTELEKIQRAKMYIDKMANGINPITDEQTVDDDTLNNVRVSRCLFYVSDILRQVIENGGNIGKQAKSGKQQFSITQKELSQFTLSSTPIPVSEITKRINSLVEDRPMTKLKHTSITSFLIESGFLVQTETGDGHHAKLPTEQGKSIGISTEERVGQNGTYRVTVYNTDAQQFILDNIDAVIEINNRARADKAEKAELQGQPWTNTHDETLIDLYRKNVPISETAITLKRTTSGIRGRLKKLGLIEGNVAE